MIIGAIIAGIAPAIAQRIATGSVVTPDGHRYASMGRGEKQPRPFSLRCVATWLPPTTEAWDIASLSGVLMSTIAVYFITLEMTCTENTAMFASALWGAMPYTRRLLVWPVLTDSLSLGLIAVTGLLALHADNWFVVVAVSALIIGGQYVHERVTVHASVLAWFVTGSFLWFIPMALGLWWYFVRYQTQDAHEEETTTDYLVSPMKTAIAHHRQVLFNASVWLLPWGASLAWLLSPSWQLGVVALASYAPCLVSIDRVRTYQANPFPFVIASCMVLPVEWWLPAYLFTLFISDGAN